MTPSPRLLVADLNDGRPLWAAPDWALREIRDALPPGWEMRTVTGEAPGAGDDPGDEACEAVRGAEVYLGWGFPAPLLRAAGAGLRWVHSAAAGVGGVLYPEMRASPVLLTNSAATHAEPIADWVLAGVLHFARGLDVAVRAQAERRWDKSPFDARDAPLRELAELRVGIHGLGGIGAAAARRFVALGSRVTASRRRSGEAPPGVSVVTGDDALPRLLEASDVLVVAVPRTPATEGSIGAAELARLPAGAIVVVVSRGGIVDEAALAAALRSGRLRGAAMDVFAQEPLGAESPLWSLPNVLLTPHVSGASHRFWRRQADLIVENLRRYAAGEPLRNLVDKQAGY